ncbi:hypothetical protein SBV1_2230012 [Verrucomicrobia bacterium]|nr:hypothetical protein SBV1_2230012 [Verrucomicrobiota bacterium]
MVAYRSSQYGVASFESIEHGVQGGLAFDLNLRLPRNAGEIAKVKREHYPDHGKVCASTDNTAGKSRTMGFHESPPSEEP